MSASVNLARLAELLPAEAWVPEDELAQYAVQGMTPLAAVRPDSEAQTVAVMELAVADKWAVVPWGGGTAQGRGAPPEQYDLCLSTERMTAVLEHHPEDMVATVQAGARLADVQQTLTAQGQWWPLDPPDAHATVGGIVATNRSGPRRALYGTARDHVLGMRVLHADGTVTKHGGKVVKNVAGFDLNKLHIGALGTLGIVLEVSVKVRPVPAHETVIAHAFPDFATAAGALATLVAGTLQPTAIELLNEAAAHQIVPTCPGPAVGLVAVEGPPMAVERQIREVGDLLGGRGGSAATIIDRGDVRHVWDGFRDLGHGNGDAAALWCTVAALPEHVAALAAGAQAIADDHSQRALIDVRVVNGVMRLGLVGQPRTTLATRVVAAWRELATARGGTLVVDAAPPDVRKQVDVWGPLREDFFLMHQLKRSFDPHRLFNRGRYVGGI